MQRVVTKICDADKKKSEIIEEFLNLLNESSSKYSFNSEKVNEKDRLKSDIEHKFELQKLDRNQRAKLGTALTKCMQERREYKDEAQEWEILFNFSQDDANEKFIKNIKKMLGDLRKQENYHDNRSYMPRVMTMDEWSNDYYG